MMSFTVAVNLYSGCGSALGAVWVCWAHEAVMAASVAAQTHPKIFRINPPKRTPCYRGPCRPDLKKLLNYLSETDSIRGLTALPAMPRSLGLPNSTVHRAIDPDSLDSTVTIAWGAFHSTSTTVPVIVMGLVQSNSGEKA